MLSEPFGFSDVTAVTLARSDQSEWGLTGRNKALRVQFIFHSGHLQLHLSILINTFHEKTAAEKNGHVHSGSLL